jgi:predicted nucleotidyltransferase
MNSYKNKKILVFGMGFFGRASFRKLIEEKQNSIIGFVDNNISSNQKLFFGRKVYRPSQILSIDYDLIVISGRDVNAIKNQLHLDLKIPLNKIVIFSRSDLRLSENIKKNKEKAIINILQKLTHEISSNNISYWMDFSALLAIYRNEELSDFSDVDIAINSQEDAKKICEIMDQKNINFNLQKFLVDEDLDYASVGDLKQICIQSEVNLEKEEPAIIDIHVKFFHENLFKSPFGKFTFYTPASYLNGFEEIYYKDLSLRVPLNSESYLELIYGKNWKIPAENWKVGDYGNILDEL